MTDRVAKIVWAIVCVVMLCSLVFSLMHGFGKWSIPMYVLTAYMGFSSAWLGRSRHNAIEFWAGTALGLVGVALVVETLTGISWLVPATGVPAGVMGIVYFWDLDKRGWRIFEPRN